MGERIDKNQFVQTDTHIKRICLVLRLMVKIVMLNYVTHFFRHIQIDETNTSCNTLSVNMFGFEQGVRLTSALVARLLCDIYI